MQCVELFAGAGGAALGIEAVGFTHIALCEWDKNACATLRAAGLGPVLEGDVRSQDWDQYRGQVDMLWSSFPCTPWSMAAADRKDAAFDERNMWPATMDACDDISPAWFIAENVPGLTHHNGDCEQDPSTSPLDCPGCYFNRVIVAGLRDRFDWVEVWKLNSVDYGAGQRRRRIFMVAGPRYVKRPTATHCDPRLSLLVATGMTPWRTMHDVIGVDVMEPSITVCATEYKGARHMGNADMERTPMRASDQLWRATGRRRLEIEECALLQDFPVDHPFQGGKTSRYKQVGNAVPPSLAQAVAGAIYSMSTKPSVSNSGSSTSTSPSTGSGSASGSTS